MTYLKTTFGNDVQLFDKFFVGFDEHFNRLAKVHDAVAKNPTYPPYNLRKIGDHKYLIEIAVAGFVEDEIDISVEDDTLTIKGSAKNHETTEYLYKGIGMRDFTRTFALNEFVEVRDASLVNGLLRISLEKVIPEHKLPKKIPITSDSKPSKRKLLTE